MRAFVALEIPDQFRYEMAGLARQLRATVKGRFVDPDNYHVTLAFLGDIDERDVQAAMDAIDAVCEECASVPLAYDGLGKFGKSRDATLWLGLRPCDELMALAAKMREELVSQGIGFDSKSFKPHITIARRAVIPGGSLPALPFPESAIATDVVLFKSVLSSEGATYHPLHMGKLTTRGQSPSG